jgi:gluconate 2-dehydrogenase gamma chain
MEQDSFTRRRFLGVAAAGVGSALLLPACGGAPAPWHFFTEAEAGLVEAITAQLIPGDDAPGARDVGVLLFIDRQLTGPYRDLQATYRDGLAGVQQASQARFGRAFEALRPEEQEALLVQIEAGDAPGAAWDRVAPAAFFETIRSHTMQGFYGPPRHGGNARFASYRMLGLDYPPVAGRNR